MGNCIVVRKTASKNVVDIIGQKPAYLACYMNGYQFIYSSIADSANSNQLNRSSSLPAGPKLWTNFSNSDNTYTGNGACGLTSSSVTATGGWGFNAPSTYEYKSITFYYSMMSSAMPDTAVYVNGLSWPLYRSTGFRYGTESQWIPICYEIFKMMGDIT